MADSTSVSKELQRLIAAAFDCRIDEDDVRRLGQLLLENDEAQRHFLTMASLDCDLHFIMARERVIRIDADDFLPSDVRAATAFACVHRQFSRRTPFSMTVAGLVMVAIVTAMAFMAPPFYRAMTKSDKDPVVDPFRIVAEVTGLHEVEWVEAIHRLHQGAFLIPGRSLQLNAGVIEVTYRDGAVVSLEGPCQYVVADLGRGQLNRGRLLARIPEAAIGFRVATPTTTIEDLGTEFGVEVHASGEARVVVLEGNVICLREQRGGVSSVPVALTKGQAATFSNGGTVSRHNPSDVELAATKWRGLQAVRNTPRTDIDAEFVAYHDLGGEPSPGNITTQVKIASKVDLIDFSNGADTGIDFSIDGTADLDTRASGETRPPRAGTPAANLFLVSGIDLDDGFVHQMGGVFSLVISGLSPNQRYDVALYGDRDAPPDGVERFTLTGAEAARNRSSSGIVDVFTTDLETRPNAMTGHVVRWTDIAPTADGRIAIEVATRDRNIAYISAVRVAQQKPRPDAANDEPSRDP